MHILLLYTHLERLIKYNGKGKLLCLEPCKAYQIVFDDSASLKKFTININWKIPKITTEKKLDLNLHDLQLVYCELSSVFKDFIKNRDEFKESIVKLPEPYHQALIVLHQKYCNLLTNLEITSVGNCYVMSKKIRKMIAICEYSLTLTSKLETYSTFQPAYPNGIANLEHLVSRYLELFKKTTFKEGTDLRLFSKKIKAINKSFADIDWRIRIAENLRTIYQKNISFEFDDMSCRVSFVNQDFNQQALVEWTLATYHDGTFNFKGDSLKHFENFLEIKILLLNIEQQLSSSSFFAELIPEIQSQLRLYLQAMHKEAFAVNKSSFEASRQSLTAIRDLVKDLNHDLSPFTMLPAPFLLEKCTQTLLTCQQAMHNLPYLSRLLHNMTKSISLVLGAGFGIGGMLFLFSGFGNVLLLCAVFGSSMGGYFSYRFAQWLLEFSPIERMRRHQTKFAQKLSHIVRIWVNPLSAFNTGKQLEAYNVPVRIFSKGNHYILDTLEEAAAVQLAKQLWAVDIQKSYTVQQLQEGTHYQISLMTKEFKQLQAILKDKQNYEIQLNHLLPKIEILYPVTHHHNFSYQLTQTLAEAIIRADNLSSLIAFLRHKQIPFTIVQEQQAIKLEADQLQVILGQSKSLEKAAHAFTQFKTNRTYCIVDIKRQDNEVAFQIVMQGTVYTSPLMKQFQSLKLNPRITTRRPHAILTLTSQEFDQLICYLTSQVSPALSNQIGCLSQQASI